MIMYQINGNKGHTSSRYWPRNLSQSSNLTLEICAQSRGRAVSPKTHLVLCSQKLSIVNCILLIQLVQDDPFDTIDLKCPVVNISVLLSECDDARGVFTTILYSTLV